MKQKLNISLFFKVGLVIFLSQLISGCTGSIYTKSYEPVELENKHKGYILFISPSYENSWDWSDSLQKKTKQTLWSLKDALNSLLPTPPIPEKGFLPMMITYKKKNLFSSSEDNGPLHIKRSRELLKIYCNYFECAIELNKIYYSNGPYLIISNISASDATNGLNAEPGEFLILIQFQDAKPEIVYESLRKWTESLKKKTGYFQNTSNKKPDYCSYDHSITLSPIKLDYWNWTKSCWENRTKDKKVPFYIFN